MTANSLLKNLLHIKGAVVDSFDLGENAKGEPSLVVHVHVGKGLRWRCPVCGRKCHVHDYVCDEAFWRSMDLDREWGLSPNRVGAWRSNAGIPAHLQLIYSSSIFHSFVVISECSPDCPGDARMSALSHERSVPYGQEEPSVRL